MRPPQTRFYLANVTVKLRAVLARRWLCQRRDKADPSASTVCYTTPPLSILRHLYSRQKAADLRCKLTCLGIARSTLHCTCVGCRFSNFWE
jgi:hypothetical protein